MNTLSNVSYYHCFIVKRCCFFLKISDRLDNSSDIDLELEMVTPPFEDISVFKQGNVKASRKKVLPILKSFLHGDLTPDVLSKEFVTQSSVTAAVEGFSSMCEMTDSTADEAAVVFNLASVDGEHSSEGTENGAAFKSPSLDFLESESVNNSNFLSSDTGQAAKADFDPFQPVNSQSENSAQNVAGEMSSGAKFLSSANSSNLLDFAISDSELVDPFSSVEDSFQPNINKSMSLEYNPEKNKAEANSLTSEGDIFGSDINSSNKNDNVNLNPFLDMNNDFQTDKSSENKTGNLNPFGDPFQPVGDESNQSGFASSNVTGDTGILFDFTNSEQAINPVQSDQSNSAQLLDFTEFSVKSDENASSEPKLKQNNTKNPFDMFGDNVEESSNNSGNEYGQTNQFANVDGFLDMDSLTVGTPPLNEKSISLIVECDPLSQADNLAELDESDLFDKVPTPEIQHSGENSPFMNSGFSTPFEAEPGRTVRTASESSAGFAVPPNSLMDVGFEGDHKDHGLPSFNSAEMVERIHRKKASLGGGVDLIDSKQLTLASGGSVTPYTPQNSFRDDMETYIKDHSLPSLNNSNILEKVQKKRDSLGAGLGLRTGEEDELTSDTTVNSTSNNPFGEFSNDPLQDDSKTELSGSANPFLNIDEDKDGDKMDSLEHVPFTPVNTFVDTSPEMYMKSRNSLTDPELMYKLNELKLEKDAQDENRTNPFDIMDGDNLPMGTSENQSGSQDLVGIFGAPTVLEGNQPVNSNSLNPFVNVEEHQNTKGECKREGILGSLDSENNRKISYRG